MQDFTQHISNVAISSVSDIDALYEAVRLGVSESLLTSFRRAHRVEI